MEADQQETRGIDEEMALLRRRVDLLEEMVNTLALDLRRLYEEVDSDEHP